MRNLGPLVTLTSLLFAGCARFPGEPVSNPAPRQLIVTVRFAVPVDERYYYFVALDTNQDASDGPVPVVQGPYWGNGWGTGPIAVFVEYHNGQFSVNEPFVLLTLTSTDGSIIGLQGTPSEPLAGTHTLSVQEVTFLGGRPLTAAEQAALDALNAGGVLLEPDSLAALGLSLTVRTSGFLGGVQTITVAGTRGVVLDRFVPAGGFTETESSGEVLPKVTTVLSGEGNILAVTNLSDQNAGVLTITTDDAGRTVAGGVSFVPGAAASDPAPSPIPGVVLVAGDLVVGQRATVVAQMSPTANYLGPPYLQEPVTGDTLSFTLDLETVGAELQTLDINFIATDKLIIDPDSPEEKTYDALGTPATSEFVSISTRYSFAYTNELSSVPEEEGDCEIPSLDIVDWTLEIRLLGD